jgi:hypothetical protein
VVDPIAGLRFNLSSLSVRCIAVGQPGVLSKAGLEGKQYQRTQEFIALQKRADEDQKGGLIMYRLLVLLLVLGLLLYLSGCPGGGDGGHRYRSHQTPVPGAFLLALIGAGSVIWTDRIRRKKKGKDDYD